MLLRWWSPSTDSPRAVSYVARPDMCDLPDQILKPWFKLMATVVFENLLNSRVPVFTVGPLFGWRPTLVDRPGLYMGKYVVPLDVATGIS